MSNEIQEYLEKKKQLQRSLLDYIEIENNYKEHFQKLIPIFEIQKIQEDKNELIIFLSLLSKISKYHHHTSDFFNKIEHIILYFLDDIKKNLSNHDIFRVFKENKRIILFLIKKQIITLDQRIALEIQGDSDRLNDDLFYLTEVAQFLSIRNKMKLDEFKSQYKPDLFEKLRENGENEYYICELIRNDLIDEFISYTNEQNISLDINIKSSVFDTNCCLQIYNDISLIEYATFCGSFNIFKYLFSKVKTNSLIWYCAISGQDIEILNHLNQNGLQLPQNHENQIIAGSIKCHHLNITDYLRQIKNIESQDINDSIIYSFNYAYFPNENELIKENNFRQLCSSNHVNLVNLLLKKHQDLCKNGQFLNVSIYHQCNEIVQLLLNNPEADVNHLDHDQRSPLFNAVSCENIEIVEMLLSHPKIDVNLAIKLNKTPLHIAVSKNNIKIIKLLLNHPSININLIDSYNNTPLISAIFTNNIEIVNILLDDQRINVNLSSSDDTLPLNIAVSRNCKEIIQLLLNHPGINESISQNANKILCSAAESGNIEIIQLLLSNQNVDINCKNAIGKTPLYCAIEKEQNEAALYLLKHPNVDFNYEIKYTDEWAKMAITIKSTILHLAIQKRNEKIVKELLENFDSKININDKEIIEERSRTNEIRSIEEKTILMTAIDSNVIEIIELLLSTEKIDINENSIKTKYVPYNSKEEIPALYYASAKGYLSAVKLFLLNNKINVNSTYIRINPNPPDMMFFHQDNITETSIIVASRKGYSDIVQLLLQHQDIDVNYLNSFRIKDDWTDEGGNRDSERGRILKLNVLMNLHCM